MRLIIWPILQHVLALTLVWNAASQAAGQTVDCSTPRRAVETLFEWQRPASLDLKKAGQCIQLPLGSKLSRPDAASRILNAFEVRGLLVDPDTISDERDYRDPDTGKQSITPEPELPGVVIARAPDGKWRWTAASVSYVDALQGDMGRALTAFVKRLPPSFHGVLFDVEVWQYLALFGVVLLGIVVRKVLAYVIAHRISGLAQRLGQAWASNMISAFASPGATVAMALMLRIVYPIIGLPMGPARVMAAAVRVMVVLSIVWTGYQLVEVLAARMALRARATESKLDDQLVPLVRRLLKIMVLLTGGVFILQNLQIDVGSLLAGLGIGGLAFALAAKDTIANLFGSVMIFVDKPFQIGDWVKVEGVEGIVEEVGFRSTRIRTFYDSLVSIPNASFTESQIDNYGKRRYRRVYTTLNLTYDTTPDQMQAFVEGVRAIIRNNEHTRKDYYEVHMSGFGAHSLDVMLYFFLQVDGWSSELRERHRIFLEIMRLASELRVGFAFPTQTLHVDFLQAPGAARAVPTALENLAMADVVDSFGPGGYAGRPMGPHVSRGYYATTAAAGKPSSSQSGVRNAIAEPRT